MQTQESTVNIQNGSTIPSLPSNSVIKVTAKIGKNGPVAVNVGDLPEQLKGYTQHLKSFERMAVEAFMKKDKQMAYIALTINPLAHSEKQAKIIFDELFQAHKKYLEYFK